jgi:hypothetical protein
VRLAIVGRGEFGLLPGPPIAPALSVALRRAPWVIALTGAVWPERDGALDATRGGRFTGVFAALSGEYQWSSGAFRAGPYGALEGGVVFARGYGVSGPSRASEPWVAVGFGAAGEWAIGSVFALTARAGATVPLARPLYVLEGVGAVFQGAPVTGRFEIGAAAYF